jgi:CxxC motif-containing protein
LEEQRQFICVTCPVGCALDVIVEGDTLRSIQGQACKRGVEFVRKELTAPKRMLTTTVRVRGGVLPLVPVRSAEPLPKPLLRQAAASLRQVVLTAPICEHQVVVPNILNTGVDIIASRELPSAQDAPC